MLRIFTLGAVRKFCKKPDLGGLAASIFAKKNPILAANRAIDCYKITFFQVCYM
jgi:hypothetical protein